ncbi:MAG: carbohydrate ABC transporter substrate-binding protein [Clostridia bacterium]|nr:carbohydrate ABC transporter substrate-binding protein [Clostridia bacterium]
MIRASAMFLSIVILLGVCGCRASKPADKETEVMELTFSFWEPGMAHELEDALQKVADGYEELHPDIHIELLPQAVETYQDWIKSRLVSDDLPDIQSNHGTNLTTQYNAGMILNITDMLNSESPYEKGRLWKECFDKRHLNNNTAKEYKYIPFFGTSLGVYYNKTIYDELNLQVPDTWDEFMANCEAIENAGKLPIAFMAQKFDACSWIKWEIAGGLFARKHLSDPDININGDLSVSSYEAYRATLTGELDFTKDVEYQEEYREYVKYLREFLQYCGGFPGFEESVAKAMFLSGEAAHIHTGSWDVQGIMKNEGIDFEVGIFQFPRFTEANTPYVGKRISNLSEQSIAITKSVYKEEGKLEAAVDFLRYLTSKEVYQQFINDTAQIPVVKDIAYVEGTEVFKIDGYSHDELLLKTEGDTIIHEILSGKEPILDDRFFKQMQEKLIAVASDYAQKHNLSAENGYYLEETPNGVFEDEK